MYVQFRVILKGIFSGLSSGPSEDSRLHLNARTHCRHLISLITFEIAGRIKNDRHQLPPVTILEPMYTTGCCLYVCVKRACVLIDMTSCKGAETLVPRICLQGSIWLTFEELLSTKLPSILNAHEKIAIQRSIFPRQVSIN